MIAPHAQPAGIIAEQVRVGQASAVAICRGALDQAEHLGVRGGFTRVLRTRALLRAEAVNKLVEAGLDPGPLAGVPFGAADLFDVVLQPTTAGSQVRLHAPMARRDAKPIALLEAAGAVLIGTSGGSCQCSRAPRWRRALQGCF